jgi:hypothetical protein
VSKFLGETAESKMWQPNLRDSSWQTLIPRKLFPLASKRGEKTPIASLPGTTATISPLTLLLAGNPTVYAAVSQRVNRVRCDEPRCGPNRQPSRNSVAATARPGLRPEQLSPHNCKAGGLIGSSSFGCPSESTLIVRKLGAPSLAGETVSVVTKHVSCGSLSV